MLKNGTGQLRPISYGSIYDKGFSKSKMSEEELDRHKTVAMRMALGRDNGKGFPEWDPVISALTTFIIFYTPDFLDLDDPSMVTRAQSMFAGLLQR